MCSSRVHDSVVSSGVADKAAMNCTSASAGSSLVSAGALGGSVLLRPSPDRVLAFREACKLCGDAMRARTRLRSRGNGVCMQV